MSEDVIKELESIYCLLVTGAGSHLHKYIDILNAELIDRNTLENEQKFR